MLAKEKITQAGLNIRSLYEAHLNKKENPEKRSFLLSKMAVILFGSL